MEVITVKVLISQWGSLSAYITFYSGNTEFERLNEKEKVKNFNLTDW